MCLTISLVTAYMHVQYIVATSLPLLFSGHILYTAIFFMQLKDKFKCNKQTIHLFVVLQEEDKASKIFLLHNYTGENNGVITPAC